jgi:Tol biopolymer transport system component
LGLPVHRHHTGTVYAYKSELDAWWASRKREIDSEPTSIESPSTAESPPASWLRRYGFQIAGVGLIAVGILASFVHRPKLQPEPRLFSVTTYPGVEGAPSLSPDGNQVAFMRNSDIFVKQVDSEGSVQLTNTPDAERSPVWSPDGKLIAFRRGSFILTVSPLGGGEKRVAEARLPPVLARMAWTPDSKALVFGELTSPICASLFILSIETGEKHRLTQPPEPSIGDGWPSVSPDGRTLAFARFPQDGMPTIYVQPLTGGEPRQITSDTATIMGLVWTPDGKEVVFSSDRGGTQRLWRIPANSSSISPIPVEYAGDDALFPSFSRPGRGTPARLAYQRYVLDSDIYRAGIEGEGTARHALKPAAPFLVSTKIDGPSQFSPDGKKVAFVSTRSSVQAIWLADSDGSNAVQLTYMRQSSGAPRWSPDGRHIGFHAPTGALGKYQAYTVDMGGGPPIRLSRNENNVDFLPTWSRDGQWIYFGSGRSGTVQLWKMPAGGGEPFQITKGGGADAMESLDGRFVYYTKVPSIGPGLWRVPTGGGEEVHVLDSPTFGWWDIVRDGIYFVDFTIASKAHKPVKFFNFKTQEVRQIGTVERPDMGGLAISPDSRWLLYSMLKSEEADLMLLDNFR